MGNYCQQNIPSYINQFENHDDDDDKNFLEEIKSHFKQNILCLPNQGSSTIIIDKNQPDKGAIIKKKQKQFVYIGKLQNQKPHGEGTIIFRDKSAFQGKFACGQASGDGMYTSADKKLKFKGKWFKGLPKSGQLQLNDQKYNIKDLNLNLKTVQMTFPQKNQYSGEYKCIDNMYYLEGWGKMNFLNGNFYKGNWVKSQMSGYGTFIWANKQSYEGQFKDGKRNGKGIYYSHDKNVYLDCQWKDGKPCNGQATQTINGKVNRVYINNEQINNMKQSKFK